METLAEVFNSGADSVTAANQDVLDPFTSPATNDMFIGAGYSQLFSRDLITNSSGTYFFMMEASKMPKVIDLRNLACEVTFQVVKVVDGKEYGVVSTDGVSVTNHLVDSLFSNIEIIVNSAPIYKSPSYRYHYVQLTHLLGESAVKNTGSAYLAMSDPETRPTQTLRAYNTYFGSRSDRICATYPTRVQAPEDGVPSTSVIYESVPVAELDRKTIAPKNVYATGVLSHGFSNCRQFLPWNSEIIVNVTKQEDCHLLHVGKINQSDTVADPSPGEFRLKIVNLSLSYRHYILNDYWYKKHMDLYNSGERCKIYFMKPYTNHQCIQVGEQLFFRDIGFPGRRLAKMFVVFMSSNRFVGSLKTASNSYQQLPQLRNCQLLLSGREPLQMDAGVVRSTDNSLMEKLYFDLLHNNQVFSRETQNNTLTFQHFKNDAFILSLNLVANGLLESDKLPLLMSGPITLKVELKSPLSEAWYVYYVGHAISLMEAAPGLPPQLSEKLEMEK